MHIEEWYYRYQHGNLLMLDLVFVKPLFYYLLSFLATFFLARKAFRDDLQLPYKMLGVVATVLFVIYLLMAGILICGALFDISLFPWGYAINLTLIMDYCGLLCIPGILFGLVAEKRWKVQ